MTAPRRILPGSTYLVTRRCINRRFLLRPSLVVNQLFLYVFAVAAARYGIQVHALCVMSNHWHAVVTDPDARLPAFTQYVDALVARAMNVVHRRSDAFWSAQGCSAVLLDAPIDFVAKVAYVLANPVSAGLVDRGREWPGVWTAPERIGSGEAIEAERPEAFFRAGGPLPDRVKLELTVPPGFESADAFRRAVTEELEALEHAARLRIAAEGRRFLGAAGVLAQDPSASPASEEPRRKIIPRVAAADGERRSVLLAAIGDFLDRYRAALQERRAGRDVPFPAGTYLLRVWQLARCEAPA